jgi:hypothetical protein
MMAQCLASVTARQALETANHAGCSRVTQGERHLDAVGPTVRAWFSCAESLSQPLISRRKVCRGSHESPPPVAPGRWRLVIRRGRAQAPLRSALKPAANPSLVGGILRIEHFGQLRLFHRNHDTVHVRQHDQQ